MPTASDWSVVVSFVISVYAPTTCSSHEATNEFCRELCRLLRTDVVSVVSGFNAQLGYLAKTKRHITGQFSVTSDRIVSGDHLIKVCSDHKLFLASTNLCHTKRRRLTWCSYSPSQNLSRWWRGSVEGCRSFWCKQSNAGRYQSSVRYGGDHEDKFSGEPQHSPTRWVVAICLEGRWRNVNTRVSQTPDVGLEKERFIWTCQ